MRKYEFAFALRTSLKEADVKKLFETMKGWLGEEVKVTKEEDWGQKPLAYPIKKETAGHYYMWQLETQPNKAGDPTSPPKGFETNVIRNDGVLRHLVLRTK
jgi:small subunit ribosomal protein S6